MATKYVITPGQRFGRLVTVSQSPTRKHHWLCKCDCGKELEVYKYTLFAEHDRSCGCLQKKYHFQSGLRFGRLTTVSVSDKRNKHGRYPWLCICDCGSKMLVQPEHLFKKATVSCGCFQVQRTIERNKANTKHGHCVGPVMSPTHNTWASMKQRCLDVDSDNYPKYGGAGITICERWTVFENFLADMGERPDGCTLDRIDNSKGYSRENCRWATPKEQARNRRNSLKLTIGRQTMTLVEWSEKVGIPYHKLKKRLTDGLTPEEVLGLAAQ